MNPPNTFSLFGLQIAFYGVIMSVAIIVAVLIICAISKYRDIKNDNILTCALFAIPLGIVGARFLHVMLNLSNFTFYEAIAFWEGWSGLSIYGAVMFGAIGVVIGCLIKKMNFLKIADVIVPGIIIAQAIGRWGNFFNQELYGSIVDFNIFPFSVFIEATGHYHLGLFFIESLCNIVGFIILLIVLKKVKIPGVVMCSYFIFYGTIRAILEPLRMNGMDKIGNVMAQQVISFVLIAVGLALLTYLIVKELKKKKQKKEAKNV